MSMSIRYDIDTPEGRGRLLALEGVAKMVESLANLLKCSEQAALALIAAAMQTPALTAGAIVEIHAETIRECARRTVSPGRMTRR